MMMRGLNSGITADLQLHAVLACISLTRGLLLDEVAHISW